MTDRHERIDRGWRNRPVVREPDGQVARRLWGTVLSLAIACAPFGAYLVLHNASLQTTYEMNRFRSEIEALEKESRELEVERVRLESLARIEDWARQQGELERAAPDQVVVIVRHADAEAAGLLAHATRMRAGGGT
jgi:cell division protein FtsL